MTNVNQAPLPRLSKRRWYVLRLLSGAISSTWLYLALQLWGSETPAQRHIQPTKQCDSNSGLPLADVPYTD